MEVLGTTSAGQFERRTIGLANIMRPLWKNRGAATRRPFGLNYYRNNCIISVNWPTDASFNFLWLIRVLPAPVTKETGICPLQAPNPISKKKKQMAGSGIANPVAIYLA